MILAAAPSLLLSHAAGGWVTKYTNRRRRWRAGHAPSQAGKTVVVTGGTSGIGLITATELARKGARVIVCGRDLTKAAAAVQAIKVSLVASGDSAAAGAVEP